jgi:hypothetical protein
MRSQAESRTARYRPERSLRDAPDPNLMQEARNTALLYNGYALLLETNCNLGRRSSRSSEIVSLTEGVR